MHVQSQRIFGKELARAFRTRMQHIGMLFTDVILQEVHRFKEQIAVRAWQLRFFAHMTRSMDDERSIENKTGRTLIALQFIRFRINERGNTWVTLIIVTVDVQLVRIVSFSCGETARTNL